MINAVVKNINVVNIVDNHLQMEKICMTAADCI